MKKFSITGLALFFCLVFASSGLCANSLTNPSVESGSLSSWSTYSNDLNSSSGWATDAYRTGSRSAKITNTKGLNAGWYADSITLSSPYPKTITLGGYSKAQGVNLGTKGLYCLDYYIQFEDGTSTWYTTNLKFSSGTHDWEKKEATVTFPKGIKLIKPYCLLYYGATGTAWFDDLYAIPQGSANILVNPSMEGGIPEGWVTSNNNLTTSTGWATDTCYSTGSRSLKIVNTQGKDSLWRGSNTTFTSPYPKTVTLGGYSRAQNVVLGSRGLYCLDYYIQFEDNTSTWYVNNLKFTPGTHGWEKRETTVTFPKGIKLIRPHGLLYYGATGTAWFDNFYAFANPPQCLSMSPTNPTVQQTVPTSIQTTFSHPNGWQSIYYVLFIINNTIDAKNCFYGNYNQNTNKLYLRDDSGVNWLGGFAPGSANTIENSYAKINCANTTIAGSGNNLTVNWSVTFKNTFQGTKNAYLYVYDDALNTDGWKQMGIVTIAAQDNTNPLIQITSPQNGEIIQ